MSKKLAKTMFVSFAVIGVAAVTVTMVLLVIAASPEFIEYS